MNQIRLRQFKMNYKHIEIDYGFSKNSLLSNKPTSRKTVLENRINNILYTLHLHNQFTLNDQISLALICLDIIVSPSIDCDKFKKKL